MPHHSRKKPKKRTTPESIEKVTTRLFPPYSERVAEHLQAAGVTPSQFTRQAIMLVIDGGLIHANQRLARIEEQLIRLRKDFNEAIE